MKTKEGLALVANARENYEAGERHASEARMLDPKQIA